MCDKDVILTCNVLIVAIQKLPIFQCKTFNVVWQGKPAVLTLDWNVGFVLTDTESGAVSWKYKFSQLKGSSDDNKCRLKLHFQLSESRIIETRVSLKYLTYCSAIQTSNIS
jgi:hypothetical protein